jgi:hypothetical protein
MEVPRINEISSYAISELRKTIKKVKRMPIFPCGDASIMETKVRKNIAEG